MPIKADISGYEDEVFTFGRKQPFAVIYGQPCFIFAAGFPQPRQYLDFTHMWFASGRDDRRDIDQAAPEIFGNTERNSSIEYVSLQVLETTISTPG